MDGLIAVLGISKFGHSFGGNSWDIVDPKPIAGGPHLLLNFDLNDPELDRLRISGMNSFPICSYINVDLWISPQRFQIKPESNDVEVVERSNEFTTIMNDEFAFPNPLPRKSISLRRMTDSELPSNHSLACEKFIGGNSFIRVLGEPLWLQHAETVKCVCDKETEYICSVGYENYSKPGGFLNNKPFFIGEAALYFFICKDCKILTAISQST